jgi:protein involved in polysaccharide export with SLBB domain
VPNAQELKAAIQENPALLDTPQARAMMKKEGLTKSEIEARIKEEKNKSITKKTIGADDIENNIAIMDANATDVNVTDANATDANEFNPFMYKTNTELNKNLKEKQQLFMENKLKRYIDSFYVNKNMIDSASLPTPDNYAISTGDVINIHIYGDRDINYELEVSNEGEIEIEYIGPLRVGGMSFSELKVYLVEHLKPHFKLSSFKINISKYSSIQVTLIGDVKFPGIYNLSSFSTVKDLFIVSKGVRKNASVRDIEIKRDGKTIAHLDFYNLLFNGKDIGTILLKHGDIVLVKRAQKLVSIDGYVNHAAIFELKNDETLAKLIQYAGGMQASASKRHIKVERYSQNMISETFHISFRKAKKFTMRDGDRVYIYKLDSSTDTSVSVYGNVIRPGVYGLGDHNTLSAFLKENLEFGLKNFFLPETYFEYALIKRYGQSLDYETHSVNLAKVINAKEDIKLYPQDEIFIFSKHDIQTTEYVTTKGETLINPTKLRYIKGMTIQDAINASGVDGILDDQVRVTTINTKNGMPKTNFYSLKLNGNTLLSPYDEVEVYDYYNKHTLEPVSIKGEVVYPTTVFYEEGLTLEKLIEIGGGYTQKAYLEKIEIVRFYIDENNHRKKKIFTYDIKKQKAKEFKIEPYDEVTVFKIPDWNDKRVVTLKGEVKFPGEYTISSGEKLSSVIQRAGGFTEDAFIEGAVFTRESIRERQIKQYNRSLARVKRELALYNAMPANAKKSSMSANSASNSINEVIEEAQKYQPIGRVAIYLNKDLEEFQKGEFNLVLKNNDELTIPSQIDTVTVFGEVFNPTSFVYNKDLTAEDYIKMASGLSRSADEDSIYVIHANGMSEPLNSGWMSSGSVKIAKGDTIVVPLYIKEYNTLELWDSVSRILASFAITAATLTTLGVF